jgi:regulator of protease activity HflC (stomatin/prohibitin superfamily)
MTGLVVLLVIAVLIVVLVRAGVRVVREYQRVVVFRFGRCIGARGPGIVPLIPVVDRPVLVDLRESYLDIPKQTCITRDNAPISIDFLIYSRVEDPVSSVIRVNNFAGAVTGMATTNLRAVVGDLDLDSVLARRDQINQTMASKLDAVTEGWGVKVTRVEIREITPPKDVSDAMIRQMSAERTRRAVVTEADGAKQAAITVAEGEKQAAILKAEGQRQSQILVAEGYALGVKAIYDVARTIDERTMALQYLDALRSIGQAPSTKWIVPMELSGLIRPFVETMRGGGDGKV